MNKYYFKTFYINEGMLIATLSHYILLVTYYSNIVLCQVYVHAVHQILFHVKLLLTSA